MVDKTNTHLGSSFDSFLEEEGILDEVDAVAVKRVIAWQLEQAMAEKNIHKKQLADQIGTSRSQLDRLLDPENANVQLRTITRAARRVGLRLRVELEPIPENEQEVAIA
jgi:DNA-binding phage protein